MVSIEMIDFQDVSVFEVQFTPTAFPLLPLEQFRLDLMHHRMSLEALAPIQQVSVIRAGSFPHLDVSLNLGGTVHPQFCAFGC